MIYVIMPFIALAVGFLKPRVWALLVIPAVCVTIGILAEQHYAGQADQQPQHADFLFGALSALLALLAGLTASGVVSLWRRHKSRT